MEGESQDEERRKRGKSSGLLESPEAGKNGRRGLSFCLFARFISSVIQKLSPFVLFAPASRSLRGRNGEKSSRSRNAA